MTGLVGHDYAKLKTFVIPGLTVIVIPGLTVIVIPGLTVIVIPGLTLVVIPGLTGDLYNIGIINDFPCQILP